MTKRTTPLLILMSVALWPAAAEAGPCTSQLDGLQAKIDALIEATAAQGNFAVESKSATMQRQPTPNSIAAAEAQLGEGKPAEAATKAMADARAADASGDAAACNAAIQQIEAALK